MQKLKQIPKRVHHFLIGLVLTAVLGVLAFAVVNTYSPTSRTFAGETPSTQPSPHLNFSPTPPP